MSEMNSGSVMNETLHVLCCSGNRELHVSHLLAAETDAYHPNVNSKQTAIYRKEVGRRLKEARIRAGIRTQSDAAKMLSNATEQTVEPSRIGNYEQGTRMPDPLTMKVLCGIYKTYPSLMYGFEEAPATPEEVKLLARYRNTDERGRDAISGIAEQQPDVYSSSNKP
jgi:transcriptional regulator with XRE-family HTH domain